MLSTDVPSEIAVPFGNSGSRNTIPVPSQIGITDGAASFTDGFPPLTYTDPTAGGIAPSAQDFNGILYAVTIKQRWADAGGFPMFNTAFSTAVSGYPKWSILQSSTGLGLWVSTADNNTSNPDAGGAGWAPLVFFGSGSQTVAGANVTLTTSQAAQPIIFITGTLTADVTLTFPAWVKQWLVVNSTTGAHALTAKTASGSPITLLAGSNLIYGDGSNVLLASVVRPGDFTSSANTVLAVGSSSAAAGTIGSSGWSSGPSGKRQWAAIQLLDDISTTPISWTFPNATLFGAGINKFRMSNLAAMASQGSNAQGGIASLISASSTGITVYGKDTNASGTKFWALLEVEGF